jgi:hypothetical protein
MIMHNYVESLGPASELSTLVQGNSTMNRLFESFTANLGLLLGKTLRNTCTGLLADFHLWPNGCQFIHISLVPQLRWLSSNIPTPNRAKEPLYSFNMYGCALSIATLSIALFLVCPGESVRSVRASSHVHSSSLQAVQLFLPLLGLERRNGYKDCEPTCFTLQLPALKI